MALTLGTPKPVDSLSSFRDATNPAVMINGTVRALAVYASWLYLGGDFTAIDNVMRSHVARVSRHGERSTKSWNVTADKTVRDMVIVNGTLYLVGDFTKVNGVERAQAGGRW